LARMGALWTMHHDEACVGEEAPGLLFGFFIFLMFIIGFFFLNSKNKVAYYKVSSWVLFYLMD